MNKIKSLFLAVALVLGVGAAYAFSVADEPPCFVEGSVGYTSIITPNGTAPSLTAPERIQGTYQTEEIVGNHTCVPNPPVTCRFVYAVTDEAPAGRWFTCTGNLVLFED
ncbi:hypothetical protein [Chitinophaga cymbidii]|uniref:Uncharacterized protein n=1 Tax=Chitinophaga cymbidii TaxID=1096750 RepID=A0A512RFN9_9BACT|nr:hypothetical protein [Chitinophaga cymbidii]GEP94520.1 hypothetical protein CCY01nite_07800 [Chitinophaga cymbidii]